jgi:hypothetical protein
MAISPKMTIAPRCLNRECRRRLPARSFPNGRQEVPCPACQAGIAVTMDETACELSSCPVCSGREFFVRKDFPQRAGLMLVFVFGIAATIFYYKQNIVATFATLFLLVIIDAFIYFFVGKVSVCYKCRAEFRNIAYNPEHGGFDLATSEKYD